MATVPKYNVDQRIMIAAEDDQFFGSLGTVKAVQHRNWPKRIVYLIALDGTIHELWYAEWEIERILL